MSAAPERASSGAARRRLDRTAVVAAAADLADERGLDGVTLVGVADDLGVRSPSLYSHVDGLGGLLRGVAALGAEALGDALAAATVGRAGDDALEALADAYRAFALAHPGRYAALQRAPDRRDEALATASDRVVGVVLAVLGGYGLSGEEAIHAARALRSALHGFVTLEMVGGFGMPLDVDESFRRLVILLGAGLRQ